ncbi:hypothetical protein CLV24_10298 [Pontibacter ummariensis]|uniref:Uncharacterized protein n=1 Tax=Pontibacter ummariensis TaxID=1610492 RepID=A0A239C4E7_9BACT|nr:hypothetical protein CLV24_10298 [Pontibacter ummariensis]SNS14558.1 hypothetical protein SAMN06296052_102315 [Pontibacter ummariensis]
MFLNQLHDTILHYLKPLCLSFVCPKPAESDTPFSPHIRRAKAVHFISTTAKHLGLISGFTRIQQRYGWQGSVGMQGTGKTSCSYTECAGRKRVFWGYGSKMITLRQNKKPQHKHTLRLFSDGNLCICTAFPNDLFQRANTLRALIR